MAVKTITCKLRVTQETAAALEETMQTFSQVCNYLSGLAWDTKQFRQFDLHHAGYHSAREQFNIPSQLVVRAIRVVTDSYKVDRSILHKFGPLSAVVFDARCFKMRNLSSVELTTTRGRHRFVMAHGGKQREQLAYGLANGTIGEADLTLRDGNYYLGISIKFPEPPPADTSGGMLGVDLGIVQIAVDSEGNEYTGEGTKAYRRRIARIRGLLQKKGTKSAKRRLKRISRRVGRFTKDVNHCISKKLVQTAKSSRKALALETLKGIRARANGLRREFRKRMGSWSFDQLGQFIVYKAEDAGLPVIFVDPRNTSRSCSSCGYCDKANRASLSHFKCLQCGFDMNADRNAAINIGVRAALSTCLLFQAA